MNRKVQVMGVINLTADSFYSESRSVNVDDALKFAEQMIAEGADMLDFGAESSRPGASGVSEIEEISRLRPVIAACRKRWNIPLSVDTRKSRVADEVLGLGANMINDITGLQKDEQMAKVIARHGAQVAVMHMQGTPGTMQDDPRYEDLIGEILLYLKNSVRIAEEAGIHPNHICIDPGIGFGKKLEHNLEILNRLDEFCCLGKPILLGVSRKSFLGQILDVAVDDRLEGTLAATVAGIIKGASIIRAHDVRATVRVARVTEAIMGAG